MAQLVTRIDDELAVALDALIDAGVVATRSEAVRLGLYGLVDRHRRASIGQAIVDGYQRHPQGEDDLGWDDAATARMIADEPW